MSGLPGLGERVAQRGNQRQVAGSQRGHPDDVHVVVDGLAGDLVGGGEQGPHVDVEADVGEGRRDHLLAAVVAVLSHLGDQDARPSAVGLGELLDQFRCGMDVADLPHLVSVDTGDGANLGLMTAVDLLQRVGDLPDGGLGPRSVDGQRHEVVAKTVRRPAMPDARGAGQFGQRRLGRPLRRGRPAAVRASRSARRAPCCSRP